MHFQSTSLILYGWELLQWLDLVQNFIPYGSGTRFCQLLLAHLSLLLICLARSVVVVISLCLLFLELLYHPCTARIALPADQSSLILFQQTCTPKPLLTQRNYNSFSSLGFQESPPTYPFTEMGPHKPTAPGSVLITWKMKHIISHNIQHANRSNI